MGQPHKHAEIIKAWADGVEIERLWKRPQHQEWIPCPESDPPTWNEEIEFRIKPEPPKYPQTSYSETTLACICHNNGTKKPSLTDVANMAIARAILDGDVVPAAMLENVAKDAASYGYNQAGGHRGLYLGSDFYDIIAKVKEGK